MGAYKCAENVIVSCLWNKKSFYLIRTCLGIYFNHPKMNLFLTYCSWSHGVAHISNLPRVEFGKSLRKKVCLSWNSCANTTNPGPETTVNNPPNQIFTSWLGGPSSSSEQLALCGTVLPVWCRIKKPVKGHAVLISQLFTNWKYRVSLFVV